MEMARRGTQKLLGWRRIYVCDGGGGVSLGQGLSREWVRAHKKVGTGGETLIPMIEPEEASGKSGGGNDQVEVSAPALLG